MFFKQCLILLGLQIVEFVVTLSIACSSIIASDACEWQAGDMVGVAVTVKVGGIADIVSCLEEYNNCCSLSRNHVLVAFS